MPGCTLTPDHRIEPCETLAKMLSPASGLRIESFVGYPSMPFRAQRLVVHRSKKLRAFANVCPFCGNAILEPWPRPAEAGD